MSKPLDNNTHAPSNTHTEDSRVINRRNILLAGTTFAAASAMAPQLSAAFR
jgi:hypothetical protein